MQTIGLATTFLIGALSGLGVGSGGLLTIYLTTFMSVGQLEAQSINLVFFVFSAGASLLWHYTHRQVDATALFLIVVPGICGAFFGSGAAAKADPTTLSSFFGVMLIISGVTTVYRALFSITKKKRAERE